MEIKINKIIFFAVNLLLVTIIIIFDNRSGVFGEPSLQNISSLSVAISFLTYHLDGLVGLIEVFNVLNKMNIINDYSTRYYFIFGEYLTNFENTEQLNFYKDNISKIIQDAQNLKIEDINNQHIYFGDIGYIIYVILAFLLFGIKLSSIKFLFLSILISTSVLFMISYYKNNVLYYILQTTLFSIILMIIGNFGGSTETFSLTNYRFITILSIIPVFHLLFIVLDDKNLNKLKYFICVTQLFFLLLLCFVRGTALIGLFFIVLFYFFYLFANKTNKDKLINYSILSLLVISFLSWNSGKILLKKNLSDLYDNDFARTKHTVWHNAFIGLSFYPKFHEEYVCSDEIFDDIFEISPRKCGEYQELFPGKNSFIKNIVYFQPRDIHGYSATLKYLKKIGSDKNLGVKNSININTGLNWNLHETIMKKLYYEAIIKNPLEFLYLSVIIKPIKLAYEFVKFPIYFFNAFKLNGLLLGGVALVALIFHVLFVKSVRINAQNTLIKNQLKKISLTFMFLFYFYSLPSLIFYPSVSSSLPELIVFIIVLLSVFLQLKLTKTNVVSK